MEWIQEKIACDELKKGLKVTGNFAETRKQRNVALAGREYESKSLLFLIGEIIHDDFPMWVF